MTSRKLLIFFIFLIFLFFLLVVLLQRQSTPLIKELVYPTPHPTIRGDEPVPNIGVPEIENIAPSVAFSFSLSSKNFPQTMPVYQIISDIDVSTKKSLLPLFSFSGDGRKEKSGEDEFFIWSVPSRKLMFLFNPPNISYIDSEPTIGEAPTEEISFVALENILKTHVLIPPSFSTIRSNAIFYQQDGYQLVPLISRSGANYTEVSILFTLESLPVYRDNILQLGASLMLDGNNRIKVFRSSLPPTVEFFQNSRLISLSEASLLLKNNKGTLLSLSFPNIGFKDISSPSFSSVSISSVDLVYVAVSDDKKIVPYYLFKGATNQRVGGVFGVASFLVTAIYPN